MDGIRPRRKKHHEKHISKYLEMAKRVAGSLALAALGILGIYLLVELVDSIRTDSGCLVCGVVGNPVDERVSPSGNQRGCICDSEDRLWLRSVNR